MTRSLDERLVDILEAIAAARIADERLRLADTQGDAGGMGVAFGAILRNLFVVGEAVKAIPIDVLEREAEMPWAEIASMRDVIGHHYHRIVPAIIHRTVEHDLGPLEAAILRLRSTI